MTMIRVDAIEMNQASEHLECAAHTVAAIGTAVRTSTLPCSMAPAVAAQVTATLTSVGAGLARLQEELLVEALNLALRGVLAAQDATAVAGMAAADLAALAPAGAGFAPSAVSSPAATLGSMVGGVGGFTTPTVPTTVTSLGSMVGGVGGFSVTTSSPGGDPLGMPIVGGVHRSTSSPHGGAMGGGSMLITFEGTRGMGAFFPTPSVTGGGASLSSLPTPRGPNVWTLESRGAMSDREGRPISLSEYDSRRGGGNPL